MLQRVVPLLILAAFSHLALANDIRYDDAAGYARQRPENEGRGFILTAPRVLWSGRRETACLSLHGTEGNSSTGTSTVIITVHTDILRHSATTKKIIESENGGCFEFRVPNTTDEDATLQLQLKFSDSQSNYSINSVEHVKIYPSTGITIVQTDKEIYAPGDRVRIRILILSQELGVPNDLRIPVVKIRNPAGIAIGQWENVTTELGLVQLEHQLSQDTVLGTWFIELERTSRTFLVQEYVLPRFRVHFRKEDKPLWAGADVFELTVCARYPYGAGVKGTTHVKLQFAYREHSLNQIKELTDGCALFIFRREEFPVKVLDAQQLDGIYPTATVTEHNSGHVETATAHFPLAADKYTVEFVNMSEYFQPGLPYHGLVKVTQAFESLANKTIKICYNLGINTSWNLTDEVCSNYNISREQTVPFTLLPFEPDIHTIRINAKIDGVGTTQKERTVYFSAAKWFSPSNSYIQIYQNTSTPVKCKSWQQFYILYTLNDTVVNGSIIFNYLIKSKGHLLKYGKVSHMYNKQAFSKDEYPNVLQRPDSPEASLPIDKFILTVKIHQKMYGEAQLLVYYVHSSGEIIGMNTNIHVEHCLSNKVDAGWTTKQRFPGESALLKLKAAAGSLCAVGAVDVRSRYMSPPPATLSIPRLLRVARRLESSRQLLPPCYADETPPFWDLRRRRRRRRSLQYSMAPFSDMRQVFNSFGVFIMTDLKLLTAPCPREFGGGWGSARTPWNLMAERERTPADNYEAQATSRGVDVRWNFPETWLWELVRVGRSGEMVLKRELPHSVTEWSGEVLCVSPSAGLGIATPFRIASFRPFYVDVLAPYSVRRGETVHVRVLVFNHLNYSLPVRVTIDGGKRVRLTGPASEITSASCIPPRDPVYTVFRVTAVSAGFVNVTVTAELDSSYPGECGPEILLNRRDVVVKTLRVELEGYPIENVQSSFMCIDENSTKASKEVMWNLELPYDVVKNSTRFKILMDNDMLALTMENFDALYDMPTGCGEQVMATLAPNLYMIRYLKAVSNLTQSVLKKALDNIKIGYERILLYKHRDNSFSAFGETWGEGSVFLTAFVVRTLALASQYAYVDRRVIDAAAAWILNRQLENGCFAAGEHVFQRDGEGIATGDENTAGGGVRREVVENAGLTAYVLMSLLEANVSVPVSVAENARYCLRAPGGHARTLAMAAYALALIGRHDEARRAVDRLLELATRRDTLVWWEHTASPAIAVETAAYAVLALLHARGAEDGADGTEDERRRVAAAGSVARWLVTRRNARGGFLSTQDTVAALDALTRYAATAKGVPTDLAVSVTVGGGRRHTYRLRDGERLQTKQLRTDLEAGQQVKFELRGKGCAILQTVLRYRTPQLISGEAFRLAVSAAPVSTVDRCSVASLTPCLSSSMFPNPGMTVLDLQLPSGYRADRASLHRLLREHTEVKRFEEIEDRVILYFTQLTDQRLCVPFLINERSTVESREPANVKIYDYYNPEFSTTASYDIFKCMIEKPLNDYIQDDAYILTSSNYTDDFETGLNPSFVDIDFDLDFPDGVEGPEPVQVDAPADIAMVNDPPDKQH